MGLGAGIVAVPLVRIASTSFLAQFPAELYNTALGRDYLRYVLQGVSEEALYKEFHIAMPWYSGFSPRTALRMVSEKDYYEGNTLEVKGWILPRIVVVLCALMALEKSHVY